MMCNIGNPSLRKVAAAITMAAVCSAVGCSSDPEPAELTPPDASSLISQSWSHDGFTHFTVTFHSDTVIGCGIQNGLWNRVETEHQGFTISTYKLTDAGRKDLFAIDLKDSGKYHEVILQGPYTLEVTSITPGSQADTRQATIRWEIDWNKAPAAMKACLPRFELSGTQVALFRLFGLEWKFLSFLKPGEVAAPPQASARSESRDGTLLAVAAQP